MKYVWMSNIFLSLDIPKYGLMLFVLADEKQRENKTHQNRIPNAEKERKKER